MTTEDTYVSGGHPQANAANPAQVKASTKLRDWERDEQANDLRKVLQLPEGQRLVLWLLEESRAMLDPFNRDPLQMAHDVGVQEMGRKLIAKLNQADPAAFPRLLLYRLEEKNRIEAERAQLIAKEKIS